MESGNEKWITVAEAAKKSGYSAIMVRKLLEAGRIKGIKPGRDWFTTLKAVMEYKRNAKRGRPKLKK